MCFLRLRPRSPRRQGYRIQVPQRKSNPFPPCGGRMRSLSERSELRRSWMGGSAAIAARARKSATSCDGDAAQTNQDATLAYRSSALPRCAPLGAPPPIQLRLSSARASPSPRILPPQGGKGSFARLTSSNAIGLHRHAPGRHTSAPVRNSDTRMPPCETGSEGGANGRPVAWASAASLVTSPTRQPVKRAASVSPSAR
jgi:hypothetical protein